MKKKGSLIVMVVLIIALIVGYVVINHKLEVDPNTKKITVVVVKSDGSEIKHNITTNAGNLEDALMAEDFVKGENGAYGLYITEVEGEYVKYEVNNCYWAMYRGDEALETGAKDTLIKDGEIYKLVFTKL